MRRILLALAFCAAAAAAVAQSVGVPMVQSIGPTDITRIIPSAAPSAQSVYASMLQLQAWVFGGNSQRTGTTAPALGVNCGTAPSIAGNDYAGVVTMGTGTPVACTITFNTAYVAAPTCVVSSQTAYGTSTLSYTVSTTAITTGQAAIDSNKVSYVCVAKAGG